MASNENINNEGKEIFPFFKYQKAMTSEIEKSVIKIKKFDYIRFRIFL